MQDNCPISRSLAIISAKSLLSHKIAFTGSRDWDLGISEGHYSTYHTQYKHKNREKGRLKPNKCWEDK